VRAGSESALVQRHQESDCAGSRIVAFCSGLGALAFDEPRDVPVEIEFRSVDLEIHGMRDALGEYLLCHPRAIRTTLREVDHRLLGAPQVERRATAIHCLVYGLHVGIGIGVK